MNQLIPGLVALLVGMAVCIFYLRTRPPDPENGLRSKMNLDLVTVSDLPEQEPKKTLSVMGIVLSFSLGDEERQLKPLLLTFKKFGDRYFLDGDSRQYVSVMLHGNHFSTYRTSRGEFEKSVIEAIEGALNGKVGSQASGLYSKRAKTPAFRLEMER